jgi:hypothetical protein
MDSSSCKSGLHHVSRLLIMSSFSFDMTGFTDPSQFIPFLQSYVTNEAYYLYDGKNPHLLLSYLTNTII